MRRRLVLTADDLGREEGSIRPILDLVTDGPLTATTLIPVSPTSVQAAAAARCAGISPRLHVTLTSERGLAAWRPLDRTARSLTDEGGWLHTDPAVLGVVGASADVAAEVRAQADWMLGQGLSPGGLDSHAGTLYGLTGRSWLAQTLQFCAQRQLAFRLPRDPTRYLGAGADPAVLRAHARAVALADSLDVALPEAIVTNQQSAVELGGYQALRARYLDLLAGLPEGTSEMFLHPAPVESVHGPDAELRGWELRLLRDRQFHRALDAEGVELVASWAGR